MCFECTSTRGKIAKEDIECWKMLKAGYLSPYGAFFGYPIVKYKTKEIQPRVKIKPVGSVWPEIKEGYHSFKTIQDCEDNIREYTLGIGLNEDVFCAKFIIPKGVRYFENSIEYVSETIMML